ncbi:hypothetical protein Lfu02_19860 [Longispora fulva]|uniref:Uncharacterized protein n=1 Tax=Longispora fulva TaxID=619741 RepID=A0A8J7KSU4_9ACTN|nr:hypothetical protein [Longispora fulva]MBG6140007.1 hypothetical protein [Longispora fulva]GIG57614.1 hypothetical protein Lfu02_19860 [Longispora fulva]
MTQPAHDPTSGAETPEEPSPLHNARPATLADLSAGDQARPVRRSVRPGQGIHGQSSELPPDMRQISASASVRQAPDGPARSYPVIGGGESLSSADAGIPGPVQQAPAGYGTPDVPGGTFGGDVPGAASAGHVPGGASFSSGGASFGGAGTFGGAAPTGSAVSPAGSDGAAGFGGMAPGATGSGGSDPSTADSPGVGPAQPPLPKPDESPTMILPIIGAVKPLTVRRVLAGAAGVIALIIAGLLVLNVMIPEEKKGSSAPRPAQPVAQTTSLPAAPSPSPTPTAVRHKPVAELCSRLEAGPVRGLYPTVGAGAPTGLTCTVPLEFKPPAGTPPKPPQHRSGSLAGTAVYYPSGAEAVTAYGAKLADPATSLVSTVGSQAGMVTVAAGKTVTVTVHVLDDNVLLSFVFVAGREDKDWTAPEVDQLKALTTQVASGTLAKI